MRTSKEWIDPVSQDVESFPEEVIMQMSEQKQGINWRRWRGASVPDPRNRQRSWAWEDWVELERRPAAGPRKERELVQGRQEPGHTGLEGPWPLS